MPNLNVSYEQMATEANALRAGQDRITQELTTLRTRINNLVSSGFVTDSASVAFNQSYEQFNQGATTTISALENLAAALTGAASTLQQADQALGQQMGS